jgi:hypothetical protein
MCRPSPVPGRAASGTRHSARCRSASVSGATHPTCTRLWYVIPILPHRRQLHRLQASSGGRRRPYGGTRSLGLKRGTIVMHSKYGMCTVGGFDRRRNTLSLHAYRTNTRLTKFGAIADCQRRTGVAFRSWFVREQSKKNPTRKGEAAFPPTT